MSEPTDQPPDKQKPDFVRLTSVDANPLARKKNKGASSAKKMILAGAFIVLVLAVPWNDAGLMFVISVVSVYFVGSEFIDRVT